MLKFSTSGSEQTSCQKCHAVCRLECLVMKPKRTRMRAYEGCVSRPRLVVIAPMRCSFLLLTVFVLRKSIEIPVKPFQENTQEVRQCRRKHPMNYAESRRRKIKKQKVIARIRNLRRVGSQGTRTEI